jgi:hypothetical protein
MLRAGGTRVGTGFGIRDHARMSISANFLVAFDNLMTSNAAIHCTLVVRDTAVVSLS